MVKLDNAECEKYCLNRLREGNALLLSVIRNPDDDECKKRLFSNIAGYYGQRITANGGGVDSVNSMSCYYSLFRDTPAANEAAKVMEEEIKCNEDNIMKVVELINREHYDDAWSNSNIFDKSFIEISKTPVFLPWVFPNLLSGEYLLYILHGDKVSFWNVNTENYNCKYQRFFGSSKKTRENSVVGQFSRCLNISMENLDKKIAGNLFRLMEIYAYVENKKIGYGRKKLFNNMGRIMVDVFAAVQMKMFNGGVGNNLLFETLLLQMLSDEEVIEMACYELCWKKCLLEYDKVIDKIILGELIHIKTKIGHEGDGGLIEELNNCTMWFKEAIEEIANEEIIEVDENNLYKIVLWKILSLKHAECFSFRLKVRQLVKKSIDLDDEQKKIFKLIHSDMKINVETRLQFKRKYGDIIKTFFPGMTDREYNQLWDVCIKVILYWYPKRFNFYYYIHNEYAPKTIKQKWIKEHNINLTDLREREIFSLMLVVDMIRKEDVELYKNLDNIRSNDLSINIRIASALCERFLMLDVIDDNIYECYIDMWEANEKALEKIKKVSTLDKEFEIIQLMKNNAFFMIKRIETRLISAAVDAGR